MIAALRFIRCYTLNLLIALDQMLNTTLGGAPDETISSALGKALRGDYGRAVALMAAPARCIVDLLFTALGEPNHCAAAIEEDEGRDSAWMMLRRIKAGSDFQEHGYDR